MKKISIVLLAVLGLLGCQSAQITDYTTFEYDSLKASVAKNDSSLAPYTVDGTIFAPILKHADHTSQLLHLTLWGKDRTFRVSQVAIRSEDETIIPLNKSVDMSKLDPGENGDKSLLLLQRIPSSAFGTNTEPVTLELSLQTGGEDRVLSYPVTKRTRTYNVQR